MIFGDRPIGDGTNLESYGFRLDELEVPRGSLAASGNSRDFLQVYENPSKILGKDLMTYNSENRRPWLVTRDRVVGVVVNGDKFSIASDSGDAVGAGTLALGGDLSVDSDKLVVTAADGNVAVAGAMAVTGTVSMSGTRLFSRLGQRSAQSDGEPSRG